MNNFVIVFAFCQLLPGDINAELPQKHNEKRVADDAKHLYESLQSEYGDTYKRQRAEYLSRKDAPNALRTICASNPKNWLAYSLYERAQNTALRNCFDQNILNTRKAGGGFIDRFDGGDVSSAAFDSKALRFLRTTPSFYPKKELLENSIDSVDLMASYALALEYVVKNPDLLSPSCCFWALRYLVESAPASTEEVNSISQLRLHHEKILRNSRSTIKPDVLYDWHESIFLKCELMHVKLAVVHRCTSKEATAAISRLLLHGTSNDIALLSLLAYGRSDIYVDAKKGRFRPFDGIKLEEAIRSMSQRQIDCITRMYIPVSEAERWQGSWNDYLNIPWATAGLIMLHHNDSVPKYFRSWWNSRTNASAKFMLNMINAQKADKGDAHTKKMRLIAIKENVKYSILWDIKNIRTMKEACGKNQELNAIVDQCISSRNSIRGSWPNGAKLNYIFQGK